MINKESSGGSSRDEYGLLSLPLFHSRCTKSRVRGSGLGSIKPESCQPYPPGVCRTLCRYVECIHVCIYISLPSSTMDV